MTPALEKWLREHVTDTARRAALADAADGLVDLYNAERIDLEDVLTISEWPAFARNRFLRAWQSLRDAGRAAALAADEGTGELVLPAGPGNPPTVATRATQTPGVIMAPARPASAAARAALKRRDRNHRGGPSLGPRDARGCFPCPAGCPRTFTHAPAAVHHGKSCTAGGARPPETNRDDETAEEAAAPPPPPPDTSRDEELARQLAGLPGRARQATQRFSSLEDAGQSYASPERAADPRRPKRPKKAKSPVAASAESSDAAEARELATDQAAIREAYAREQARATEEAREQARATEERILRIANAALTRRLGTEEEIPRGREKKRCAATRAPAETPSTAPRIEGIAAETTDDDSDAEVLPAKRVRGSAAATPARPTLPSTFAPAAADTAPVTPEIPSDKALTSPVRPEYAVTPTRKQITQQMCGESTASSSSDSDTDEDFSPDGAPVRSVESDAEDDARPPPNDDTDDDLPLPPPVVKQEPVPPEEQRAAIESGGPGEEVAPDDDDDEPEFYTCSF
ncbi:unnamed protein product [Pelagomonas calceolata]|uniref:Uncharacterized protein n=1 Tax=Pelagomonas calceolata TaxID=35677 RepID=A0A8J2SM29_9STRA|nr:unnamed protein product [Pelagomonas calceolata]|mmetsp:Transcript_24853/g.69959  ORF Transcript_24853/g.69959 Transcript_24853/m.69959 type:complete len:517 (-) Transcript_24853:33-1583(-)